MAAQEASKTHQEAVRAWPCLPQDLPDPPGCCGMRQGTWQQEAETVGNSLLCPGQMCSHSHKHITGQKKNSERAHPTLLKIRSNLQILYNVQWWPCEDIRTRKYHTLQFNSCGGCLMVAASLPTSIHPHPYFAASGISTQQLAGPPCDAAQST